MAMADNITDRQILDLRRGAFGDMLYGLIAICQIALGEIQNPHISQAAIDHARAECARIINESTGI